MMSIYKKKNDGFTLLELVVTVLISGLIIAASAQLYVQYEVHKRRTLTKERLLENERQLQYALVGARLAYSCPANRAFGPGNSGYLRQFDPNCDITTLTLDGGCSPSFTNGTANTCWGCTADGGICLLPGSRDLDDDGTVIGDDRTEAVIVGAIPVNDLREQSGERVSNELAQDAYGNLYNYAVSVGLTQDGNYDFQNGVIHLEDEHGQATGGVNNNAHYVIVSGGLNGSGVFSNQGQLVSACGDPGAPDAPVEWENCDFTNPNSTFVQAINNGGASGSNLYDDFLVASRSSGSKLWNYRAKVHVYNVNSGRVGIKTQTLDDDDPDLTVSGSVRADGSLRTGEICQDLDGDGVIDVVGGDDVCFDPELFTGPVLVDGSLRNGITCANDEKITKIDLKSHDIQSYDSSVGLTQAQVDTILGCTEVNFASLVTQDCDEGYFVHGIRANGTPVCRLGPDGDPPLPPPIHTFSFDASDFVDLYNGATHDFQNFGDGNGGGRLERP